MQAYDRLTKNNLNIRLINKKLILSEKLSSIIEFTTRD